MSFGEVILGFFRVFLLSGPFGRLEHLICKTLESFAVPGLVLFLGMKNIDTIQEAFKFTRPGSVLLISSQPFHRIDGTICFPLLIMALG
jgi:hypothetical protein